MSEVEHFIEKNWLYLVGGVIAYFAIKKVLSVASAATDAAGSAIASTYIDLTQPDPVKILARIVLPSGVLINADDAQYGDNLTFRYGGVLYKLDHRNSDNNYVAVLA